MARRQHLALTLLLTLVLFFSISYIYSSPDSASAREAARLLDKVRPRPQPAPAGADADHEPDAHDHSGSGFGFGLGNLGGLTDGLLGGESIAPKLENATLKAELGRSTWKFLHTMVAKYPEKPTAEERKTLELFFLTFGKLYPCGDCARHFRGLLKQMPPQTSSRNAAAGWLCEVHNRVHKRLKQDIFDCNKIGDFYDCGCGDDKKYSKKGGKDSQDSKDKTSVKDKTTKDDEELKEEIKRT